MSTKQKVYPWLMILLTGLLMCVMVDTYTGTISLFLPPLVKSMGASLSVVTMFFPVMIISMAIAVSQVGSLIQKVNVKWFLTISIIVGGIGSIIISRATNLIVFYAMAILLGVSSGFTGLVVQGIVINNWFAKRKNFAFSAGSYVQTIYLVILTPIINKLIQSIGWRSSFFVLSMLTLVIGIPSALFIRLRPSDIGLKPYGYDPKDPQQSHQDSSKKQVKIPRRTIIFSVAFFITLLFFISIQFASNVLQLFPTFALAVGFGPTISGMMPTIQTASDIVITPLFGVTTEKWGGKRALPFWAIVGIISMILLIISNNTHQVTFALVAAGLADIYTVLLGPGLQVFAREMFSGESFDLGMSYAGSVSYVVGAFAVPALSRIYEATKNFNTVFYFVIAFMVLVIVLIWIGSKNIFVYKVNKNAK